MAKREISNKRNLHYSNRHRLYGGSLTMMDIDYVEYDAKTNQPLVLIETKFGKIKSIDLNDREFDCLCNLAKGLGLPVLLVIYYPMKEDGSLLSSEEDNSLMTHIQYLVCGVNEEGKKLFNKPTRLSEHDWVRELYKLRGQNTMTPETTLYTEWKHGVTIPSITYRYQDSQ